MVNLKNWSKYTDEKEYLIQELLRCGEDKRRIPKMSDMTPKDDYPSFHRYIDNFGSFSNAIDIAYFGRKYDETEREFLINAMLRYEETEGKKPGQKDMMEYNGYPSWIRFAKEFGTWKKAHQFILPGRNNNYNWNLFNPENLNLGTIYILGYIITDGNVSGNVIRISSIDKDNLNNINQFLNPNNSLSFISKTNEYVISYRCQSWVDDFAKYYGIVPNKTGKTYIPLDYLKTYEDKAAMCRGIFDGDGCITYHKKPNSVHPMISFTFASKQICEDYIYLIEENCDITTNIKKRGNYYQFYYTSVGKCKKFYDFIYGHDNFCIERKKKRFEMIFDGTINDENDPYHTRKLIQK